MPSPPPSHQVPIDDTSSRSWRPPFGGQPAGGPGACAADTRFSRMILGWRAAILSNASAGPSGFPRPRSQFRKVWTLISMARAKSAWLSPTKRLRAAISSSGGDVSSHQSGPEPGRNGAFELLVRNLGTVDHLSRSISLEPRAASAAGMPDCENDDLSRPHVVVDVISHPGEVEATQIRVASRA